MSIEAQKTYTRGGNFSGKCIISENGKSWLFDIESDKADLIVNALNNHKALLDALKNLTNRLSSFNQENDGLSHADSEILIDMENEALAAIKQAEQ